MREHGAILHVNGIQVLGIYKINRTGRCFTWNMDHVLDFLYINPGYRFCKQGGLFWDRGPRFSGLFLWQKQGEGRSSSNRGRKWPSPLRGPVPWCPGARTRALARAWWPWVRDPGTVRHAWWPCLVAMPQVTRDGDRGPGTLHLVTRTGDRGPGTGDRGPWRAAIKKPARWRVSGSGDRGPRPSPHRTGTKVQRYTLASRTRCPGSHPRPGAALPREWTQEPGTHQTRATRSSRSPGSPDNRTP